LLEKKLENVKPIYRIRKGNEDVEDPIFEQLRMEIDLLTKERDNLNTRNSKNIDTIEQMEIKILEL
jgi:hypothetical protein